MEAYTTEHLNKLIDSSIDSNLKSTPLSNDLLIGWLIANGHRKEDKPFGRAYTCKLGVIAWFKSKNEAFGFKKNGEWFNCVDDFNLNDYIWQPFPQEKWEEMLLEYAKSRGYKNVNYKCVYSPPSSFAEFDNYRIESGNVWHIKGHNVNMVFNNETGKWAEILQPKEETKDHFVDAARYAIGVNDYPIPFYFGIDFANVTDEEPRYTKAEWIEKMKQI
jgi:hypothetical protein